jgi:hypothetical protein
MPQPLVARPIRPTLRRRRVLLAALLAAALVSLVLALVVREGRLWGVQAASDAFLMSYLALLIHYRNAAAEREMAGRALGR